MKTRFLIFLCAVAGFLSLAASETAVAGVSWSVTVFDGPLGSCGHWIDRPGYGRCWHPAYVSSDWRPYCEGYWMWTSTGWYWVSDEQWAWATYHYGRWDYDSYYGWVWVADTEWGPSWVSWRQGDEYVGWAPLPPRAGFGISGRIEIRDRPIQDRFFVFVGIGHFAEPVHRRTVIVNKTTIINKTVNITNITRVNNVVVNNGPKVETMQRVSSRKLTEPPPRTAAPRGREETAKSPQLAPKETVHRQEEPKKHETEITHSAPSSPPEPTASKHSEEQPKKHEAEAIHGAPSSPQEPAGFKSEPERKPVEKPQEKQRSEPPPSSTPPKYEKHNQPPPEQPKEEKSRKSEPRRDEGKEDKHKRGESDGN